MKEIRIRIFDAIQDIKNEKEKKMFTLNDIAKKIGDVNKKVLSNEINRLIDDGILEIVVYEPIYIALKEDAKYLKNSDI